MLITEAPFQAMRVSMLCLLIFGPLSLCADAQSYTLSGSVRDTAGHGVPNAPTNAPRVRPTRASPRGA